MTSIDVHSLQWKCCGDGGGGGGSDDDVAGGGSGGCNDNYDVDGGLNTHVTHVKTLKTDNWLYDAVAAGGKNGQEHNSDEWWQW